MKLVLSQTLRHDKNIFIAESFATLSRNLEQSNLYSTMSFEAVTKIIRQQTMYVVVGTPPVESKI